MSSSQRATPSRTDSITVNAFTYEALVDGTNQRRSVYANISTNLGLGSTSDSIDRSENYRTVVDHLRAAASDKSATARDLGYDILNRCLALSHNIEAYSIRVRSFLKTPYIPSLDDRHLDIRLLYRSLTIGKSKVPIRSGPGNAPAMPTNLREHSRTQWKFSGILGVLPEERTTKQPIVLGITLRQEFQSMIPYSHQESRDHVPTQVMKPSTNDGFEYLLHEQLARYAERTSFFTVEALGANLADEAFAIADAKYPQNSITHVSIRIGKPTAFKDVGDAGVEIARARSDLGSPVDAQLPALNAQGKHRAIIALGGNTGDRISNIEAACQVMDSRGIKVVRTSSAYETEAMYVVNQEPFLNGACEVETTLGPIELLDELQAVEKSLGRSKVIDKGPRNIDLDILLYDNVLLESDRLNIPHKLMLEREFVLRPLCDLIPHESLPRPLSSTSFSEHLNSLPTASKPLSTITPLASTLPPLDTLNPARRTQIMAVLNLTPDSFSDGGVHSPTDLTSLSQTVKSHIAAGASILDIGGQSTRPGAADVGETEELQRIVPAIKLIRSMPEATKVAISVDTYRANVAAEAVKAGADIINDVSAGTMDPEMLSTAARTGKTVVLMHMRGTPETMTTLTDYPDGVVETVGRELLERVKAAEAAGIRKWRIILDPGIGFAKKQAQNLELLRRLDELREYEGLKGLPWLVGTSRKGFIGRITDVREPRERNWGTAAAVTAAVQGGADVVRVHDVEEMAKVVKMAEAIWRIQDET
ncbi:MAG: trifunctional dihydropteroate synthetase [Pleopsidium flavum]|nr:MAG: trifunctional dihydropteroate synthetase [Pleopsidium flavum]